MGKEEGRLDYETQETHFIVINELKYLESKKKL